MAASLNCSQSIPPTNTPAIQNPLNIETFQSITLLQSDNSGSSVLDSVKINSEKAYLIKFMNISQIVGDGKYLTIKDNQYILIKKQSNYSINFKVLLDFNAEIALINLTTHTVINQIKVNKYTPTLLVVNDNYPAGTKLALRISFLDSCATKKRIQVCGAIGASDLPAKLNAITIFDNSWFIRYIPVRPPEPFLEPSPELFQPQFPSPKVSPWPIPALTGIYPWPTNVIPWAVDQPLPPDTGTPIIAPHDAYPKFQSLTYDIPFCIDIDFATVAPNDPVLSVFVTNFQDRGPDNQRKKLYMTALLPEVIPYYAEKIDTFINEAFGSITSYEQPVLSTYQNALIRFFLAMHVGYDTYPDYVIKYFYTFIQIISYLNPCLPERNAQMIYCNQTVKRVKEYFTQRVALIKQSEDKSCLTYWWSVAGLSDVSTVTEAVHNIIAFNQYVHVIYLVINDKFGTGTLVPVTTPPGYTRKVYNFFSKVAEASSETEQINIVREIFRLTVPNGASFSAVKQADDGTSLPQIPTVDMTPEELAAQHEAYGWQLPCNKYPIDNKVSKIQGRHIHQAIMFENYTALGLDYSAYNPSQYGPNGPFGPQFDYDVKTLISRPPPLPVPPEKNFNPEALFTVSPVDSIPGFPETVLPISDPRAIPVYPLPIYTPFGLGYRRCPSEIFNYLVILKTMEKIKNYTFYFDTVHKYPLIGVAPFTVYPDNIFFGSPPPIAPHDKETSERNQEEAKARSLEIFQRNLNSYTQHGKCPFGFDKVNGSTK